MKPKVNKDFVMEVAGILVGAVATRFVVKGIDKALPNADATLKAVLPVGAGIFLAMQKNPLIKNAGLGMIGSGGVALANSLIPGIGAPEIPDVFMDGPDEDEILYLNGPADQSILSGPADQSILSGPADQSILSGPMTMEEQMYYRMNEADGDF
jgi:hypothetical protein